MDNKEKKIDRAEKPDRIPLSAKPAGQLASMLATRGWEAPGAMDDGNFRSSSAPPIRNNFDNNNDFESGNQNYNLWAPLTNTRAKPFTPSAKPFTPQQWSVSPLTAPSPLRATTLGGASTRPPGMVEDDEQRMNKMLRNALDPSDSSYDFLVGGGGLRSSSTPPARWYQGQEGLSGRAGVDSLGMQNLDLGSGARRGGRFDNVHTTTNAHFPPEKATYNRDYELNQMRMKAQNQSMYDQHNDFQRPASAQGRYAPARGGYAPPGLDEGMDPAMAAALATISAAGNLTPQQIAQISMQLRINSPVGGQPARQHRNASPARSRREGSPDHSPTRSALLEEFRASKNRKYELRDIVGSMVEFSCDQHGSRFIQQKLESASDVERELVFVEVYPETIHLTTDVFGNYVIQKFFEHGSDEQKLALAQLMEGQVLNLSLQMYGCRVVQKAFEYVGPEQQAILIKELEGNVLKCVKDQNGNHVIQKAVERVEADKIKFIIDAFHGQVYALATHPYGCRVIQRIFEYCDESATDPLMEELQKFAISLIQDQYGNYVIQHILEKGKPKDRQFVIGKVKGQILNMSKHKFASNVVEKCVTFGSVADRKEILEEVITTKPDGTTALYTMMKDQFANYVVQKLLDVSSEPQRILLVTKIKPQLPSLKKYTYGKHLITKVEKYLIQYRIEI